jgi:hypothetical protein
MEKDFYFNIEEEVYDMLISVYWLTHCNAKAVLTRSSVVSSKILLNTYIWSLLKRCEILYGLYMKVLYVCFTGSPGWTERV